MSFWSATSDKTVPKKELAVKTIVIGDRGVGKSSLLFRYTDDDFHEYHYPSGLGVDFRNKTVEMDGTFIKLQLWDTTGPERFMFRSSSYYRGAHGVMMVFDLTNMESFNNIQKWIEAVEEFGRDDVVRILVGSKCDLRDKRVVPHFTAQAFAYRLGIPYVETSAKEAQNVKKAFLTMTVKIKAKFDSGTFENQQTVNLKAGNDVGFYERMCSC